LDTQKHILTSLLAVDSALPVAVAVEQLDLLVVADDLAVKLEVELHAAHSADVGSRSPL